MECLEEFVEHMHTRDDVGIGTSVDLWRLRIQRMRPTVDVNLRSGHCLVLSVTFVLYAFHGVPWRGVVETWQLPWSAMDSSVLDAGLVE